MELQAAQREALAERILALVLNEWDGLGSWNQTDVDAFMARVIPIIKGGQATTARLVDVYVSQVLSDMTGETVKSVGISQRDLEDLRGIPLEEVYRRPFVEVWTALKEGELFETAVANGRVRLNEVADDDLSLAYRNAHKLAFTNQPSVEGYRRVVRPELSKGGTCNLCHLAADNRYNKADLLPIHTHCRCGILPIVGKSDPAAQMNSADLAALPKPTQIPVVRNHGELGPVLQIAGQHFTNERQVA